jgi:hypothetical protein
VKVLLDEDVPHPLARQLSGHGVSTVAGLGWGGIKNGELLKLLAADGFEVFVTGDKNLQNQQTVEGRPFAVDVLSTIHWPVLCKHIPAVAQGIELALTGTVILVQCGSFSLKRRPRD